jgi:hypothetical protein
MAKESLEKTIEGLKQEIQRLKDVHEVQELMSRYFYLHTASKRKEQLELFALKTPGVRAEIADWGVWDGPEAVRRLFLGRLSGGDPHGFMVMHTLATPSIRVAGDGKTAKGVWMSPGHETFVAEGKPKGYWSWGYMTADFVKEDGKWKIWHYHVYGLFRCDYYQSWVDGILLNPPRNEEEEARTGPNKPTTYHNEYSPTSVREYVPAPPEPYEAFDESKAY